MKEKLTAEQLEQLPSTAVMVWRRRFRLAVHPIELLAADPRPKFSCPISIGRLGFETPKGRFWILDKEKPPTYTAPNEDWAREAGYKPGDKLSPDDPMNPLRGAWLRLTWDGIGIHGTASFPLGQKASHGCIRVRPEDAVKLFKLVELGSPVYVL